MNTKILTVENIKAIWGEIFFNKQSKVTKITDESVLNANAFADSRLAQIDLKEIALIESNVFPQYASGTQLDYAGNLFASISRYGASGSSTYLLVIGEPGTFYPQVSTVFTGNHGINFTLVADLTIDDNGFGYGKVSSTDTGIKTNVDPNTITIVSPEPVGHIGVTNEFAAIGGRDSESDEDFRSRIKSHSNLQAQKTLAYLLEAVRLFNSDVLLLQNLGYDELGVLQIGILMQNGTDLTQNELNALLDDVKDYFALSDLNNQGEVAGVKFLNTTYYQIGGETVGVDFRVSLYNNYNPDTVRKNIQINMSRYLDPRSWVYNKNIQWTDLLRIAKETEGVKFIPDNYFYPNTDQDVPLTQFPRIIKFIMRDMDGNIVSDNAGVITPVFYPNN